MYYSILFSWGQCWLGRTKPISERLDISVIKQALLDVISSSDGNILQLYFGLYEFAPTQNKFIPVILPQFLPVILPQFLQVVVLQHSLPGCHCAHLRQSRERRRSLLFGLCGCLWLKCGIQGRPKSEGSEGLLHGVYTHTHTFNGPLSMITR